MNISTFKYSARLPLPAGTVSPEWLGPEFLATLESLTQIDSNIFPDWDVSELYAMKAYRLAAARSRISEIITSNVVRDDLDRPEPESGYHASAHTTTHTTSRQMTLWVQTGGTLPGRPEKTWPGTVWLKAGDEIVAPDPAIVTYPLFRAALLAVNAIWQQRWACVQVFRLDYDKAPLYPGASLFPYTIFHIPWIVYLSPSLRQRPVSLPDVKTEPMPDGGILLSATEDRLNPTNPEHLRRAHLLAELMITHAGDPSR